MAVSAEEAAGGAAEGGEGRGEEAAKWAGANE